MQGSQDMGVIGVEVVARQNTGHLWVSTKKVGRRRVPSPQQKIPFQIFGGYFFVNPSCNEVFWYQSLDNCNNHGSCVSFVARRSNGQGKGHYMGVHSFQVRDRIQQKPANKKRFNMTKLNRFNL